MREVDVRTLCYSCLSDYRAAGYETVLIWSDSKDYCDRCRVKMGWMYEIKQIRPRREKNKID